MFSASREFRKSWRKFAFVFQNVKNYTEISGNFAIKAPIRHCFILKDEHTKNRNCSKQQKISVSFSCYEDSLSAYECLYFLKILPVASRLCIQTYFYESFSFLYAFFSSRCCSTRLVWAIFMRMSSFNAGVH